MSKGHRPNTTAGHSDPARSQDRRRRVTGKLGPARLAWNDRNPCEVAAHVAPPPPPGTSPQDYLAAVVASRRERDLVRLRRDAALRDRLTARR